MPRRHSRADTGVPPRSITRPPFLKLRRNKLIYSDWQIFCRCSLCSYAAQKNGSTAPSPNTITGTILHYDHKIKRIRYVRNLDIGLEFSLQWRFMRGNIFNSKDFPHQSALLSIRAKLPGQRFVHWFLIVPNETRWPRKTRSRLSDDVFGQSDFISQRGEYGIITFQPVKPLAVLLAHLKS